MSEAWFPAGDGTAGQDASMRQKCLPAYLVVDVSASMAPFQDALNRTLEDLHLTLSTSPRVSEFAHMSIVVFSHEPIMVLEMTDLAYVPSMPSVVCGGGTHYGKAFDLVRQRIDLDIPALSAQGKAVLRPAVFFLTDGEPMDSDWHGSFRALVAPGSKRRPHVITYGFGSADPAVLGKVATKAAFVATGATDQNEALSHAISSLVNTLVASATAAEMRIPAEADGYRSIPVEYVD
ncbi:vWA domain-containing protein [Streptomyces cavernae]|uniref:vWA domain-containing protein n=1 Tax=Streptomyces cavernae TaxID=2259034 RepID=UPI001EE3F66F|nr:hypothetical protein [Streptomyces cavernae]